MSLQKYGDFVRHLVDDNVREVTLLSHFAVVVIDCFGSPTEHLPLLIAQSRKAQETASLAHLADGCFRAQGSG